MRGRIDDDVDGGFALDGPYRTVAVCYLPLNLSWALQSLGAVVDRFDCTGVGEEGEELIAGPSNIGLQGASQIAAARRGEDGPKLSIQAAMLGC